MEKEEDGAREVNGLESQAESCYFVLRVVGVRSITGRV